MKAGSLPGPAIPVTSLQGDILWLIRGKWVDSIFLGPLAEVIFVAGVIEPLLLSLLLEYVPPWLADERWALVINLFLAEFDRLDPTFRIVWASRVTKTPSPLDGIRQVTTSYATFFVELLSSSSSYWLLNLWMTCSLRRIVSGYCASNKCYLSSFL